VLTLTSVVTCYGEAQALKGVSLHARPGEIVALIGANGAGKTTVLNTISGVTPARRGKVIFEEREITRLAPEQVVRLGITQVPEGRQLFASMTVEENLRLGAYPRRLARSQLRGEMEEVLEILPVLAVRLGRIAGSLSGGEQQMVAIGRGLMARPKLLLLDEPTMGLAPMLAREVLAVVGRLRERGGNVLLVEQNARAALAIADRGYVLEMGKIVLEATAKDLLENREVQRAYLGKGRRMVED
jgi:branched-chain amino acid transport system ATP-binding protein